MSDELFNKLITFHVDPKFEVFVDIIENDDIKKKLENMMEIWTSACLRAYGDEWATVYDDELLESDNLLKVEKKMFRLVNILRKNLNYTPKASDIKKLWYVFAATGDYEILAELYICIGNANAKINVRNEAADLYQHYEEIYNKVLDKSDNLFVKLTSEINTNIKKINEASKDYEDKIKPLITTDDTERDVEYLNKKIVEKADALENPVIDDTDKTKKKKKMEKLESLFDKISVDM